MTSTSAGGTIVPKWIAEAVRKRERHAGAKVLHHVAHVHAGLFFVGDEHDDDVGAGHRVGNRRDSEAVAPGLVAAGRAGPQAHHDGVAGIVQVQRVRASLAAVADDGDRLPVECAAIDVAVVVGFHQVLRR